MPPIPVGSGGGGGGSTVAGIPTKWLLIGGGAAALAFFVLPRMGGGGSAKSGQNVGADDATYGAALGPNAALALGDLQTRVLQESGYVQEQLKDYFDASAADLADTQAELTAHTDAWGGVLVKQGWQAEELQRFFGTRGDFLSGRIGIAEWLDYQEQAAERSADLWGDPILPAGIP